MDVMKAAAPLAWRPLRAVKARLHAHGLSLIRHAMVIFLCGSAGLLAWQLIRPLIHHAPAETQSLTASTPNTSAIPRAVLLARIQDRHLFGDSSPVAATAPVLTSSGSVSVIGIVYSPVAADSVALLSVGGNSVVSKVGMQLTTGQTVTGILPDRVQLNGA